VLLCTALNLSTSGRLWQLSNCYYVTQMFTDVKAAWPTTWLARGYQDGLFMLSLTVTLTLCCCSVPVSAACVWRRQLSAHVIAGTPRVRVANGPLYDVTYADYGFHSRTRLCQNCHFTTRIAFGAHIYLIRIIWSMSDLPPLANMGFWPHYVICVVLGKIIFYDQSLNSPFCGRRGRLVHVLKIVCFCFAFASSWFVFAWSQSLGSFLHISTRTQHGRCLSTFIV